MPVRGLRRVCGDEGQFSRLARRQVTPQRRGGKSLKGWEELVRHPPKSLEMVDDPGQLVREPGVFPFVDIERGEPCHAADELAVDPHAVEYSQRLDGPRGAPYRRSLP